MRPIGPYAVADIPTVAAINELFQGNERQLFDVWLAAFVTACTAYDQVKPNVHLLGQAVTNAVTRKSLSKLYEKRPAAVRNALLSMVSSLPPKDVFFCAFCGLSEDAELDHFLPKSKFPEFGFFDQNLMPICGVCNKRKGTVVKLGARRVILSPFWDLQGHACFLDATLVFGPAIVTNYHLVPGVLPNDIFAIARLHYRRLDLDTRYRKFAANKLASLMETLRPLTRTQAVDRIRSWAGAHQAPTGPNDVDIVLKRAVLRQVRPFVTWLHRNGKLA